MNELITVNDQLVVFGDNKYTAISLFKENKVINIVETIKSEISKEVYDVSTDSGRKELQKRYKQIRKWSKLLDGVGKEYVAEIKQLPKQIDAYRKAMRDALEPFADELRSPLTEWETAEEKRKNDILARINAMNLPVDHNLTTSQDFKGFLSSVESVVLDDSFQEYLGFAKETKEKSCLMLEGLIARKEKEEQEAIEAERIRVEAEKKIRLEREAQIRKEAEEKARKEAEAKAEAEKQAILKREQEAKEAQAKAERDRIAAEERAKIEQEQAVKAEHDRLAKIEANKKAKEDAERKAAEKKAANKKHRAKINNAILVHLSELDGSTDSAKKFIERIVKGEIPELTINY